MRFSVKLFFKENILILLIIFLLSLVFVGAVLYQNSLRQSSHLVNSTCNVSQNMSLQNVYYCKNMSKLTGNPHLNVSNSSYFTNVNFTARLIYVKPHVMLNCYNATDSLDVIVDYENYTINYSWKNLCKKVAVFP